MQSFWQKIRDGIRGESGQAMAEFALIFPAQLMITLAIMQLSLLYVGHQVVNYSAYQAARAEMVGEDPLKAAQIVCSAIAGRSGAGGGTISVPGWGKLDRSGGAVAKTRVAGVKTFDTKLEVTIEHDFELVIPVVNEIFAYPFKNFLQVENDGGSRSNVKRIGGVPHLTITERCAIYRPWKPENSVVGLP